MKKISFIIPCYGSEKTIEKVIHEITTVVKEKSNYTYEILCVNDCSKDNVLEVLRKLAAEDKHIKVISFTKNMNRPSAVMAGLKYSTGDYRVILDDDGQCPMRNLWGLIKPLEDGADVSMAKYPERKQNLFKNFGTAMNKAMTRFFLNRPKDLEFTNFMAMQSFIAEEIIKYDNPYPYLTGLLLRSTSNFVNVPMDERERISGTTTFSFKKMLDLWLNGITAFSIKPLRISTFVGVLCAIIGFIYGLVLIIEKLIGVNIAVGYSSIVAILLFIGGVIMIMLGIIGEYIGRIYISINNSPQYIIKEMINFDENKK